MLKVPGFFIIIILLVIIFNIRLRRGTKQNQNTLEEFIANEQEAQFARKKPIDSSLFIAIDLNRITLRPEDEYKSIVAKLRQLASSPMLYLHNETNTGLKLKYGANQLSYMIQCEQSYFLFLRTLIEYGDLLKKSEFFADAIKVLEYAVELGTDQSQCFILLSHLYVQTNEQNKIPQLLEYVAIRTQSNPFLKKIYADIVALEKNNNKEV